MQPEHRRDQVLRAVDDLAAAFVHHDRDEDEDLSADELRRWVAAGTPTIEEIVSRFEAALRKNLPTG